MKKVLVYKWGANSEPLVCEAFKAMGQDYIEFHKQINNYHSDADFAFAFMQILHGNHVDAVFSFDYFPIISMICEINKVPYISWIYDCPQYTLLSQTLVNSYNYIFCFDRVYAVQLQKMGAKNCFHYPLAGDINWFKKALVKNNDKYRCEISFVGNLYNGKNNRFRTAKFSADTLRRVEEIIETQLRESGNNTIADKLSDEMVEEIAEKCSLSLGKEYRTDKKQLVADVLGMETSARARERILYTIGKEETVTFYTSSDIPSSLESSKLDVRGYADYQSEVPLIFHNSKINLNITSATITSGIPKRIIDVLACGGFCLTNYRREIAEYFEDGKELVIYRDEDDLMDKVKYYLCHEEERQKIAANGQKAVQERFSLEKKLQEILSIALHG